MKHILKSKLLKLWKLKCEKPWAEVWREARFEVKMCNAQYVRTLLPMGCSNTAPHCVAKPISKSKVVTTDGRGTHFQIMRSWRETHFEVKM